MALSKIEFIRQNGQLGGESPNEDGVSALLYINDDATESFERVLYSIKDLEDLGYSWDGSSVGVTWVSILWHQVNEYFKYSNSKLYLKISNTISSFDDIISLKDFSNGEIKIYGVYSNIAFESTTVTSLQTKMLRLETENAPAVALFTAPITPEDAGLIDLRLLNKNFVSVHIGDDFEGSAKILRDGGLTFISNIGLVLGTTSATPIEQSIGIGTNNVVLDTEYTTPAFTDGQLVSSFSQTELDNLDTYHWNFLIKRVGSSGTFFNFDYTADADTSDYFNIALNRVYNKARRVLYTSMLPLINSKLGVDPNSGNLEATTISIFKNACNNALDDLLSSFAITGFEVIINPNQNVLATKTIEISVNLIPYGFAKIIKINLGFKPKL